VHAALLSLPLGSVRTGAAIGSASSAIRAFLRAAEPEPPPAPPRPVSPPELAKAPIETMPAPRREPEKSPAPAGAPRGSTSVAAIPATFFDPSQLTEKPRPLSEPRLDLLLPLLGRAGSASLVLYIDELGNVDGVEVESASLSPDAVERAKVIFAAVRFSPGRFDGVAVKTRVRITVGAEER